MYEASRATKIAREMGKYIVCKYSGYVKHDELK